MKTQIFLDGNKRALVIIFAKHYLISSGGGFLVILEKEAKLTAETKRIHKVIEEEEIEL